MDTHPGPDCSFVFPPHPAWVRAAREAVRTLLTAARRSDLADTAVTLTSEAVTNAVNACQAKGCTTPVTLVAEWTGPGHLRVLVHDGAAGLPARGHVASDEDESGRGLMLIEHGADAWGVCAHGPGPGKATWFVLGVPTTQTARACWSSEREGETGCTECAELLAAQRRAVDSGGMHQAVQATVAVRQHVREVHAS
ncbi:ATP-binding protein [Streptomyces triculaminicus]|uniref:ATP-binding protein n=1 Tax=Streptomyces triculaminicus TaxID=2816232 RepID=UPI0037D849A9